ncbi:MAG TPA: tetratricopeptide repeat protein [Terriglobia bacterium]|nr:tetratricopeptide repeat protein [Terriglobia bacterium]
MAIRGGRACPARPLGTASRSPTSGQALRTVPGENIARMKIELKIADTDSFGKDTLSRIRTNLGTDYVVMGSYTALGSGANSLIRVDVRVQSTLKGETLISVSETGTAAHLLELVSRVGTRLREKLGAGKSPMAEAGAVQSSLPSSPEAARLYSEGLSKLWVFEAVKARDLLQQAVTIEPEHSLTHSALAAAWAALGYDSRSREQAKQAMDLSAGLSKEQRLLVEGSYRESTREWDQAVEIYQSLFILFPDNLDYGLRLVNGQTSAGKGKDALATVKTLREMPAPTRDDPRIDLAEAAVAFSLSDFRGQQAFAAKAIQKGEERGARFVVAEGLKWEGMALWKLGQLKKASAAFEEARRAYAAVGDRRGVADVLNDLAVLFYVQGNMREAKNRYQVALDECRDIGYQAGVARALNNLALLLWEEGNLGDARAMYDKALPIYSLIEDKTNRANVLDNDALVIMALGNLAVAQKMFEQALDVRQEIGDQAGVGTSLNNLSDLYYLQGNLESASRSAEEAQQVSSTISNQSNIAFAHTFLGLVYEAQPNFVAARREHERALSIWRELGEKGYESDSRVAMAKLQMEEGRPAEGTSLLKSAVEEFQKEGVPDKEGNADALLARCLLAQGKTGEAQLAISRALALSQKSQDVTIRIPITIADARVRAASGRTAEAIKALNAAIAEATKAGMLPYQFEARAALGEVEIQYGNRIRGHDVLASLAQQASTKGFGLIARQAAASEKAFDPKPAQ